MGGRLAPGLRGVRAGAHRQCRRMSQLQLDVYGEVMDALHQARAAGFAATNRGGPCSCAFLEHLDKDLERARRRHLGSARRAAGNSPIPRSWPGWPSTVPIKSAETFGLPGPLEHMARRCAKKSTMRCARKGFDPELGSFVQSYGSKELDASLLLMPFVGFLPVDDPRDDAARSRRSNATSASTASCMRYETGHGDDGLPPGEGAFLACSFWLVDVYMLQDRTADARAAVRTADGLAQRCRPAQRGIRSAWPGVWSATFRRPSPTSPWSTARSISAARRSRSSSVRRSSTRRRRRRSPSKSTLCGRQRNSRASAIAALVYAAARMK